MADELIRRGHHVAGCARDQSAVAELAAAYGPPHFWDVVDVTDPSAVQTFADRVLREFGVPDLVLNNAALVNQNAALWEVPPDEFSRVIDVNIKGVFHVIRAFAPAMIARQSGVIVNFSSGWGRSTSPEVAPYCATKWAIEGLTRALAEELPQGMAAIPLNPGIINTQMLQSCFGAGASSYPTPEMWAKRAVPFLLNLGPGDNGEPLTAPH
jgi:NAD(P)-dependent dehydrogenase (short-subunit alcohol dehydrogenase family)